MKIKEIAVCYERKFNLGDYESAKIESTLWADLDEEDIPEDSIRKLQDVARQAVREEYLRLPKRKLG